MHTPRVGNVDAATIRPFGGATKISQTDTCGSWGLRMEANGQSTLNTYVVWQWTAATEHGLQDGADDSSTTSRTAGTDR